MGSSVKFWVSLIGFLLFFRVLVCAQKTDSGFIKQISLSHENDLFAFRGTDGYYTSGIFISYSVLRQKNKSGVIKTMDNIELGQKIFTPGIRQVFVVTELDRPITGYLSVNLSRTTFKTNNSFLKLAASAGTIGPMALGKELLAVIHPLLKIDPKSWEWIYDYGLKNEPGINAHASYGFSLIPRNSTALIQITPVSNATLGTSFTNLSQSVLFQLGAQNAMHESGFWNTRLQNGEHKTPKHQKELFAYYQPGLMYQVYNATVQGGMFRNDKGRIISKNKPFVLTNKVGAMFATNRYSVDVHVTYQTKEAKSQENNHVFGGVQFSYRFR